MTVLQVRIDTGYEVTAVSPAGETVTGTFRLPLPTTDLQQLLERVADAGARRAAAGSRLVVEGLQESARSLGRALFEGMPPDVAALLHDSLPEAGPQQVRVALHVEPPELARLPWELLNLPGRHHDFPFRHHHLIRRLPVDHPELPLRVSPPLRIVAMVGPMDRVDPPPRSELETALAGLLRAERISLHWVPGERWSDLESALRTHPDPHILHFIGHGGSDGKTGWVMVKDDDGHEEPLDGDTMATRLRGHPSIRLVLVNSCESARAGAHDPFSSVAGALIHRGKPAVVAMQFPITDRAARKFSESFYGALTEQSSVEAAVTAGRIAVEGVSTVEWATPVLHMHSPGGAIFEVWQPERVKTIPVGRDINAVAFSPNSDRLALACDGRQSRLIYTDGWTDTRLTGGLNASQYAVAFRPRTGAQLATGGLDGTARIWHGASGRLIDRLPHPAWVSDVAYSPEGDLLATACNDGIVRLWTIGAGGRPDPGSRRMLPPHGSTVRSVAFNPTGSLIATACDDGLARVWDVHQGGEPLVTFPHGAGPVFSVAFSRDGTRLATAGDDGTAQIWDTGGGDRPLHRLRHDGWVLAVAFVRGSQLLATACRDRTARIWDVDGERQLFVTHHRGTVRRVAVSSDGLRLATASYDNTCQLWLLPVATAELEVDDRLDTEETADLKASLRGFGIALSRTRPVEQIRALGDLPWWVLFLPLQAFITAIGAKLGSDAYDQLVRVLKRMRARRRPPEGQRVGLLVWEVETDRKILLEPDLPEIAYKKLMDLDLTEFEHGTLRYDRDEDEWTVS